LKFYQPNKIIVLVIERLNEDAVEPPFTSLLTENVVDVRIWQYITIMSFNSIDLYKCLHGHLQSLLMCDAAHCNSTLVKLKTALYLRFGVIFIHKQIYDANEKMMTRVWQRTRKFISKPHYEFRRKTKGAADEVAQSEKKQVKSLVSEEETNMSAV